MTVSKLGRIALVILEPVHQRKIIEGLKHAAEIQYYNKSGKRMSKIKPDQQKFNMRFPRDNST